MLKHLSPYLFLGVLLLIAYFFPWKNINWGAMTWDQPRYITVQGHAQSDKANEVASFTASISALQEEKEKAIEEVNGKVTELVNKLKEFGIEERDIKTQSINIYQEDKWNPSTQESTKGKWRVSNSVEVKLRDVSRVNDLTNLLSDSGADNVWGPNLTVDSESMYGDDLLKPAIEDAKNKAEVVADSMGVKLGEPISIVEGSFGSPIVAPMLRAEGAGMGGGGVDVQTGTTAVGKTVTVVYAVK